MTGTLRKTWLLVLATALVLLAGPAFALGLGQIEVKSQRGQPLLAEIPIISGDPAELENLQARLASPETFARIGLEPPKGIVTGLQFTVALDPRGNPVIRVTSREPVDESLLTFLLEVDWGQGRLVREYSVLVDAPRTVSAPAQPPIQAATAAPSNTIVRAPAVTPTPVAPPSEVRAAVPAKPEPIAATPPPVASEAPEPAPQSNDVPPSPVPAPAPAPSAPERTAQPVAASPGEYGPVKVGDTLGKIASTIHADGASLDQTMLALLRANPDAFIRGNINMIRRGAVLRMPSSMELSQYSAAEARAIVHEQIGQWREMRKPAMQPAAIAGDAATTAAIDSSNKPRAEDARLEIVPPSANGARQAGTRSGTDAGGEGDMLRQEMQQTKETLAARDAEVQELKARVADLEKLQQDQQQLIALKDSKLAEAQQALAARQAAAATAATAQAGPAQAPESGKAVLWPWAIAALAVVLLLAWLFMRRRSTKPARPVFDTSRLAASIPVQAQAEERADNVGEPVEPAAVRAVITDPDGGNAPTWHAGGPQPAATDAIAPLNPAPAGHDRLELARAYLDLGDVDTARSLLQEVADGGDAATRGEAARLLRELV